MKPSERIAIAWFKHKGSDVSIPEMRVYINELAEFLAAAGVDKAFSGCKVKYNIHTKEDAIVSPTLKCICVECQAIRKLEAVG